MTFRTIIKIILAFVSAAVGFMVSQFISSKEKTEHENKDLTKENEALKEEVKANAETAEKLQEIIEVKEELKNEKQEKIDKVYSGDSTDSFQSSIDILHNLANKRR